MATMAVGRMNTLHELCSVAIARGVERSVGSAGTVTARSVVPGE